jgi:hypothetical protein
MNAKFALIIGNTEYTDPGLAQLTAPGKDTEDFARVLKDQEIGAFDRVDILLNQPSSSVIEAIDEFFNQKKPDDLLVLYFSGHGVRDELGGLYLAVKNTNRFRLRSTAIKSDFIRDAMDQSRSKRQVLILDCCNSGAFAQGTKAATGVSIGTSSAFEAGYGRIILTASDSTQFAWEGDKVIGETDNSLFTHFLVEGLEGEADLDGDGHITVDELYDYAYEKVRLATPKQTPSKFSSKQQGEIVLRQSMRIEDIKPVPLPEELIEEIEDTRPYVREAAVQKLEKFLNGRNIGLARSAREALEKIVADENTTRRVAQAATQVLESFRQREQKAEEERKAREEAERIAMLKAEEERLAAEKAEAERRAKEEADRVAEEKRVALEKAKEERLAREKAQKEQKAREETERIAIKKAEEERLAREKAEAEQKAREETQRLAAQKAEEDRFAREKAEAQRKAKEAEALARAKIGRKQEAVEQEAARLKVEREATEKTEEKRVVSSGLSEFPHQTETDKITPTPKWSSIFWVTLGWTLGGAIGGALYWTMEDPVNAVVGGAIGWAIGGLAIALALRIEDGLSNWKSMFWITLAWALGGAIGWAIGENFTEAVGAGIGAALGAGIGLAITLRNAHVPSNQKNFLLTIFAWPIGSAIGWTIGEKLTGAVGAIGAALGAGIGLAITLRNAHVRSDQKNILLIIFGWAIGTAIGWAIARYFQLELGEGAIGWAIGRAIAGAIGGFVTIWQIRDGKQ